MKVRVIAAVAIAAAWAGGVAMMVRREVYKPHVERLAEAALRVTPGAVFYAVLQGGKQVGFASSTVDTAATLIEQREYLVADMVVGGKPVRATARTNVQLTRTLRMRTFDASVEADQAPVRVQGEVLGDTVLNVVVNPVPGQPADTQRLALGGPVLLPTLIPLAVALEATPRVGASYVLPLFDQTAMAPRDVRIRVVAETSFVVNDSSVFDSTSGLWTGVLPVTVKAWRLETERGLGADSWVDEQGRVVQSRQMGFELRRMPYEVAFENWRRESDVTAAKPAATTARNRDIIEATAIASNRRLRGDMNELRARLSGVPLKGLDLDGGRQSLRGDTLVVTRERNEAMAPLYFPIRGYQRGNRPELRGEPFMEIEHPEIVALAERLSERTRDPRIIAQRIHNWVRDSIKKEVTVGIPSALHVLHTRVGDCNEHTQLYVALARAAGLPARVVTGLVYLDGKFYYHAWPEVMLRGWVAVDPTFGQFPADAAHLRFVTGGLGRQAELLRLVGNLQIKVIGTR